MLYELSNHGGQNGRVGFFPDFILKWILSFDKPEDLAGKVTGKRRKRQTTTVCCYLQDNVQETCHFYN